MFTDQYNHTYFINLHLTLTSVVIYVWFELSLANLAKC